jgi:hypothetical protein
MQKIQFTTMINASPEKVWNVLWNDRTYRIWTSVFCEGSYAVSNWKEGEKINFLDPNGNGMFSVIEKMTPNKFMSFKHLGGIKNNQEQPIDEETKKWSGAHENYTLTEKNGKTELLAELDMADDHLDFFKEAFPKGLQKVKELSEQE